VVAASFFPTAAPSAPIYSFTCGCPAFTGCCSLSPHPILSVPKSRGFSPPFRVASYVPPVLETKPPHPLGGEFAPSPPAARCGCLPSQPSALCRRPSYPSELTLPASIAVLFPKHQPPSAFRGFEFSLSLTSLPQSNPRPVRVSPAPLPPPVPTRRVFSSIGLPFKTPAQHSVSGVPEPPSAATDTTAHHLALGLGSSPLCRIQSIQIPVSYFPSFFSCVQSKFLDRQRLLITHFAVPSAQLMLPAFPFLFPPRTPTQPQAAAGCPLSAACPLQSCVTLPQHQHRPFPLCSVGIPSPAPALALSPCVVSPLGPPPPAVQCAGPTPSIRPPRRVTSRPPHQSSLSLSQLRVFFNLSVLTGLLLLTPLVTLFFALCDNVFPIQCALQLSHLDFPR